MIKHSQELLKSLSIVNGILNKEFYGIDTKTIQLLEQAEGVVCHSVAFTKYDDIAKVFTSDHHEYLIFQDVSSANEYAINVGINTEDDPLFLSELKKQGETLRRYYYQKVYVKGAEYVLSYDQKHKLILPNGTVAYRIE